MEVRAVLRVSLRLFFVIALLLVTSPGTPAQVKPTDTQMEELEDAMRFFRYAFKDGSKAQKKTITEKLIRLVDLYYKIPGDNVIGEPTFHSDVEGDGLAILAKGGKVQVYLGLKAFYSPDGKTTSIPWLASTKLH